MITLPKKPITSERLREILDYDPETGVLTWKIRLSHRAKVGCQAGSVSRADGYRHLKIEGGRYVAHRLVWLYMTGKWPTDQIDHINRQRADNRWINLREASASQNMANSHRRSTLPRGVSFHKPTKRYQARIRWRGHQRHLGLFDTPEEASAKYVETARETFGEFARVE